MGETVFENTYHRTREVAKETYRYIQFKSPEAVRFWIYWGVLVALMLALIGWTRRLDVLNALFFLCMAASILHNVYRYARNVKLMIARDQEQYGETPAEINTFLTQTGVGIRPMASETAEIAYANIRYAAQTRHLILIFTKAKLFHMLHKDGFTKGTAEECLAFLKEKGVRVR